MPPPSWSFLSVTVLLFSSFLSVFSSLLSVFSPLLSVFSSLLSVFSSLLSVFSPFLSVFSSLLSVFWALLLSVVPFFSSSPEDIAPEDFLKINKKLRTKILSVSRQFQSFIIEFHESTRIEHLVANVRAEYGLRYTHIQYSTPQVSDVDRGTGTVTIGATCKSVGPCSDSDPFCPDPNTHKPHSAHHIYFLFPLH